MSDDISDEELERRMTAKLFGGRTKPITVETRRSGRKPPRVVEVEARPIPLSEGGDDCFIFTFQAVTPTGRIHLRSFRGNDCDAAVREYEQEGRVVKWISKTPEEFLNDAR